MNQAWAPAVLLSEYWLNCQQNKTGSICNTGPRCPKIVLDVGYEIFTVFLDNCCNVWSKDIFTKQYVVSSIVSCDLIVIKADSNWMTGVLRGRVDGEQKDWHLISVNHKSTVGENCHKIIALQGFHLSLLFPSLLNE